MHIVVYIFAGLFLLLAIALGHTYYKSRHSGALLMGITYALSAVLAIGHMHWLPLLAGFVLVWVFRFMGLDPGVPREPRT